MKSACEGSKKLRLHTPPNTCFQAVFFSPLLYLYDIKEMQYPQYGLLQHNGMYKHKGPTYLLLKPCVYKKQQIRKS